MLTRGEGKLPLELPSEARGRSPDPVPGGPAGRHAADPTRPAPRPLRPAATPGRRGSDSEDAQRFGAVDRDVLRRSHRRRTLFGGLPHGAEHGHPALLVPSAAVRPAARATSAARVHRGRGGGGGASGCCSVSRQWFIADEWAFLADRDGGDLGDLLRPQNEHWSTIPILVYRGLWHVVGLRSYVPYLDSGHRRAPRRRRAPPRDHAAERRRPVDRHGCGVGVRALRAGSRQHPLAHSRSGSRVRSALDLAAVVLADHDGPPEPARCRRRPVLHRVAPLHWRVGGAHRRGRPRGAPPPRPEGGGPLRGTAGCGLPGVGRDRRTRRVRALRHDARGRRASWRSTSASPSMRSGRAHSSRWGSPSSW